MFDPDEAERADMAERLSNFRRWKDHEAEVTASAQGAYMERTCGPERRSEWLGEIIGPIMGIFVTRDDAFTLGYSLGLDDIVLESAEQAMCWQGVYSEPLEEVFLALEPYLRQPNAPPSVASIAT